LFSNSSFRSSWHVEARFSINRDEHAETFAASKDERRRRNNEPRESERPTDRDVARETERDRERERGGRLPSL